jgi:streptogramin lyase
MRLVDGRFVRSSVLAIAACFAAVAIATDLAAAQATGTITEFSIPTPESHPEGIAAGPDGNIWFTEPSTDKIGKIAPTGSISEYPVAAGSLPAFITAGPDGNLWFTEENANMIGKITPSGDVTEYPLPPGAGSPAGIALGSDGNVWFTEQLTNMIGKITPAGDITEYSLPPGTCCGVGSNYPDLITAGPDGNLWFTELFGNKIGKITTSGSISEYPLPAANSNPVGITTGSDGNLWFTEPGINAIGKITTSGSISEYSIPTPGSQTAFITAGPDGNLWFTEIFGNNIGQITPAGAITEVPLPTAGAGPTGITAGPAGSNTVWFAEQNTNSIGRLSLAAPATVRFLQPLDQSTDPSNPILNTGKNGRVIPVKVTITSGTTQVTGADVPTPVVTINVSKLDSCSTLTGSDPIESFADAGSSSAGTNQLRWNALAGEWDYNLDTKPLGLVTGNCYRIDISLNGALLSNAFAVYQPTN